MAHNELAKIYQEQGDFEKAILRYKLALEVNPEFTESWVNLSNLYNQTGQTLKAQEALNKALASKPNSAEAHMSFGLSYLKEKNYKLALKEFDEVIRLNPSNDAAYYNAGFTYYNLGLQYKENGNSGEAKESFSKAILAFKSALQLKPTFADAAFNIGSVHQTQNNLSEATTWYEKALEIDPKHARSLYSLGEFYQGTDKKKAAGFFCRFLALGKTGMNVDLERVKTQVESFGGCPK